MILVGFKGRVGRFVAILEAKRLARQLAKLQTAEARKHLSGEDQANVEHMKHVLDEELKAWCGVSF